MSRSLEDKEICAYLDLVAFLSATIGSAWQGRARSRVLTGITFGRGQNGSDAITLTDVRVISARLEQEAGQDL